MVNISLKSIKNFIVKYKFFHLLVLPGFIYFVIFCYVPMVGLVIAFKDYTGLGGIKGILTSPWIGFGNFQDLFTSHYFWRLMRNTLLISTYKLIFGFPAPIILSLLLNEVFNNKFKRTVQTIVYLPHFISWVVLGGLVTMVLSSDGPINAVLGAVFHMQPIEFLSSTSLFRSVLVSTSIWKDVGWGTIIYLAAITSISQEQYESAYLEGANRFQRAWYITIPGIKFIVAILLILNIGSIIDSNFDQIFNLYNTSVYEVSDVFETFIYRRGIESAQFSYTTAVGVFKSIISLILVLGANKATKMLGEEGLW